MGENYYEILGIAQSATQEEIRKAYLNKMKDNHPDMHQDDKTYKEKSQLINEAYATLKNPEKRKQYDSTIRFTRPTGTTRTNRYNQTYTYTSSYKPNNDKNRSSYTVNTNGATGNPKNSTNSTGTYDNSKINKNNETDEEVLKLFKEKFFIFAKKYVQAMEIATYNGDMLAALKAKVQYDDLKKISELFPSQVNFEKSYRFLTNELDKIWYILGDKEIAFIKAELLMILRELLKKTTNKDFKFLLEEYKNLSQKSVAFGPNSLSYVILELIEKDSIIKEFLDILKKNNRFYDEFIKNMHKY